MAARLAALVLALAACRSTPAAPPPPAAAGCRTACDCTAGRSCVEGKCLSGTEALFCCGGCPHDAPAGQACQWPDGGMATCGASRQ